MQELLLFIFLASILQAHQTGLSYINLHEQSDAKIDVVYKKPLSDKMGQDIHIRYPSKCHQEYASPQTIENGFIINNYRLWCGKGGLANSRIWVDGLVRSDRGVLIRYEKDGKSEKSLLRSTSPVMNLSHKSTKLELFVEYVHLGVIHIWTGYDHLCFILSLLLIASNLKKVLFAISAFTLSHSITLAFGILGILTPPAPFIEAMIALSIVFLAREIVRDKETLTKRHVEIVAFIFGLLHGFGFSSSLRSIGLPQNEIPLSLFSFNVGIEIGQILFILVVSFLLYNVKKYLVKSEKKIKIPLAYLVGTISSFWLIDRVLLF